MLSAGRGHFVSWGWGLDILSQRVEYGCIWVLGLSKLRAWGVHVFAVSLSNVDYSLQVNFTSSSLP
jgi:hypothetical protein